MRKACRTVFCGESARYVHELPVVCVMSVAELMLE